MNRRIFVLTGYLFRSLFFSLAGSLYVILALAYWAIFFPPGQGTPDLANYMLVIGVFGAALSFLTTITITGRANRAENYPLVVRLPSRVEYITAVLLSALAFTFLLQLLIALLALIRGPELTLGRALEIPPIWIAPNILAAVLALHASDLVTTGWSRVAIFGALALFLLGNSTHAGLSQWLADRLGGFSRFFYEQNAIPVSDAIVRLAAWLRGPGIETLGEIFGSIFWPLRAIAGGVTTGYFTPAQALAPAILLLFATILFLLAADFFAAKDLEMTE